MKHEKTHKINQTKCDPPQVGIFQGKKRLLHAFIARLVEDMLDVLRRICAKEEQREMSVQKAFPSGTIARDSGRKSTNEMIMPLVGKKKHILYNTKKSRKYCLEITKKLTKKNLSGLAHSI